MPAVAFPIPTGHWSGVEDPTAQRRHGIEWTPWTQLDDLDYVDDLALLFHTQRQMQKKTKAIPDNSACLGQKVHRGKSKVLKNKAVVSTTLITLDGDALEDMTRFTYLGSIVDKEG